jgi:hypothetical protein
VNYLPNNRNHADLDNPNWDVIEISKINDKIIKKLLIKLSLGISDDFFICFESLMRIGEKVKPVIIPYIKENQINPFVRNVLYFILNMIENDEASPPLLPKLYNPDFIMRARTIMEIEESRKVDYLKFLLPLIDDPDDSVRWALIKLLNSLGLVNNPMVKTELETHLLKEKNPIIIKKIKEMI